MDKKNDATNCPLEYGLKIFGGRWDSKIICLLSERERLRYKEIREDVNNITDQALTSTLKKLINDGLIERFQYSEIPPKVEYALTEKGKSVIPIIRSICEWSESNNFGDLNPCHICEFEHDKV
ncbi:MAG: helix-turn-helix transcriptional regulator [Lachnospiraceae bacterium]|nr:helix-turn-helix transcriptional regulator [Lachnospiraceae bacterium]MBO7600209.1 helix-turn-helix transcriptional regulator [Lachnospiraceae bacterium]